VNQERAFVGRSADRRLRSADVVTASDDSDTVPRLHGSHAVLARLMAPSRVVGEAGDDGDPMAAGGEMLRQVADMGCDARRLGTVVDADDQDLRHCLRV
jgi:hypothetical protein